MVASARVQTLTEGAEYFKMLAEYLRNPQLVAELEDEVKNLNKLSLEEESQLSEAKFAIQQRDVIKMQVDQLQTSLLAERQSHDAYLTEQRSKFDDYVAQVSAEVAEKKTEHAKKEEFLADFESRLNQRESQLNEKAAVVKGLFDKQ